jgi:hypothetical protein
MDFARKSVFDSIQLSAGIKFIVSEDSGVENILAKKQSTPMAWHHRYNRLIVLSYVCLACI